MDSIEEYYDGRMMTFIFMMTMVTMVTTTMTMTTTITIMTTIMTSCTYLELLGDVSNLSVVSVLVLENVSLKTLL